MANIMQIITDWVTASGAGKVSVMYFGDGPTLADQREAVGDFWRVVDNNLDNSAAWTVRTDGVVLDDATGALQGSWQENTTQQGAGAGNDEPVADAVQALIRWKTSTVVGGRFLQGRQFVPGLGQLNTSNGNLGSVSRASMQGAADGLIASGTDFMIWHRPIAGSGGEARLVTSANVWTELAVLRKRRG